MIVCGDNMTAEIAIMNKLGVALAADSAATIGYQSGYKIYNSADKLFMLSAIHPVAIMIYGSAELTGIPWETIIKLYRTHIGSNKLATLQDYVTDLIAFLEKSQSALFPDTVQDAYLKMTVAEYFVLLKADIVQGLKGKKIDSDENDFSVWLTTIDSYKANLDQLPLLSGITSEYRAKVKQAVGHLFKDVVKEVFGDIQLPTPIANKLKTIAAGLVVKSIFFTSSSGVVFAGFGEEEIFPSVISTQTDGFLVNRLKRDQAEVTAITFDSSAAIAPFAQSEMVYTFMEGVNPDYNQFLLSYVSNLLDNYRESILRNLPVLAEKEKASLSDTLKQVGTKLMEDFTEEVNNYQTNTYSEPIINNVAFLPLDELASMAEALVNLTSFKRHISSDSETVGGPIDVAVISKKDGFIWIKQKHYFRPELNPHFFIQRDRLLSDNQA